MVRHKPNLLDSILPIFCVCVFFCPIAKSELIITILDQTGNPIFPVRVQVFPGKLTPDSEVESISPPSPRTDGFIGFVTDSNGMVKANLTNGSYSIVASPDLDSGKIRQSFLIIKNVSAPGKTTLFINEAVPVTVSAIGENQYTGSLEPLIAARVYFRASKRTVGYIGTLNNDGQLLTSISPGNYHIVIKGSIALHYVVLQNKQITEAQNSITFDGSQTPTASLAFKLPENTELVLNEVLSTNFSHEFIDIIENQIGYDAAYTDSFALAFSDSAPTMQLIPNLVYQFNLSYVVDLDGELYAYELRVNDFQIDHPQTYTLGNSGDSPFKLHSSTPSQTYYPGDEVQVEFGIRDKLGNQLWRMFNYSAARLTFPFVVVKDPNGIVIASNQITNELPENFFHFDFLLPQTTQLGVYRVEVSLDGKFYGKMSDSFRFTVIPKITSTPPIISDVSAPAEIQSNATIQLAANIQGSNFNNISLKLSNRFGKMHFLPIDEFQNRYLWQISPIVYQSYDENINWQITAINSHGLKSKKNGLIKVVQVDSPTIPTSLVGEKIWLSIDGTQMDPILVPVGSVQEFHVDDEMPIWNVSNGIGTIDQDGKFYSHTEAGRFGLVSAILLASSNKFGRLVQASRNITLITTDANQLLIDPYPKITLVAGAKKDFQVVLTDTFGNQIEMLKNRLHWQSDGNIGEIINNVFFAQRIGTGRVTATYENLIVSAEIEVVFGDLKSIEILPTNIKLRAGEAQKLKAIAKDMLGNQVEVNPIWSVGGGLGIIRNSIFIAKNSGEGKISATLFDLVVTTRAVVIPNNLHNITIDPFISYLPVSNDRMTYTYKFVAQGWDVAGNAVPIRNSRWAVDTAAGIINSNGLMRSINQANSQTLGSVVINGTIWSYGQTIRGQEAIAGKSVVVIQSNAPDSVQSLAIVLKNFDQIIERYTITINESQDFEAIGLDQWNQRAQILPKWSVNGNIGVIDSSGTFTSTSLGLGTIIATSVGLTTQVEVEVTPGILDRLFIDPPYLSIQVGDSCNLSISGFDVLGNSVPVDQHQLTWSIDPQVIIINQSGRLTATKAKNTQIKAEIGDRNAISQIFIRPNPTPGLVNSMPVSAMTVTVPNVSSMKLSMPTNSNLKIEKLSIIPQKPIELQVGDTQDFYLIAIYWNKELAKREFYPIPVLWQVPIGLGTIDADGRFVAHGSGAGEVRAANGNISVARLVTVTSDRILPNRSMSIASHLVNWEIISDNSVRAGETLRLSAFGQTSGGDIRYIRPIYEIFSDENIGYISTDGIFHANQAGTGQIVAKILGDVVLPPQRIPIEVVPNRPTFVQLEPNQVISEGNETDNIKFSLIAFDSCGNHTELPEIPVTWDVVGGVGSISASGVFIPKTDVELNLIGEVIATIDEANLVARAQVRHYISTNQVAQVRIEPDQIDLFPSASFQFHLVAQDLKGRQVETESVWKTIGEGLISGDGWLTVNQDATIGRAIQVIGIGSGFESRAQVTVRAMPLTRLEIQNLDNKFEADIKDVIRLKALGFDKDGNLVMVTPKWSVQPALGDFEISDDLAKFKPASTGNFQIQALEKGIASIIDIHVLSLEMNGNLQIEFRSSSSHQSIEGLGTIEEPLLLKAGAKLLLVALIDEEAIKASWKVNGRGNVHSTRENASWFRSTVVDHNLIEIVASTGNISASIFVRIVNEDLAMLRLAPETASILLDSTGIPEPQEFTYIGFDPYGNSIPDNELSVPNWSIEGGIGTISSSGIFTPIISHSDTSINGLIIARINGIAGNANVVILSEVGDLASLETISSAKQVSAGESIQISVVGKDAEGTRLPKINRNLTIVTIPEIGYLEKLENIWTYRAPEILPADRTINILAQSDNNISSLKIGIELLTGDFANINLKPRSLILRAGKAQNFELTAFDVFGNIIELSALTNQPQWTLSKPIGNISQTGTYTATQVGTTQIIIESGGVEANAEVTVTAGDIISTQILPKNLFVFAGEITEFQLLGFDQYKNRVTDLLADWRVTGFNQPRNLSAVNQKTFLWKATTTGEGEIMATLNNNLKSVAEVTVIHGKLEKLDIYIRNEKTSLGPLYIFVSGDMYQLSSIGYDAFKNEIPVQPKWRLLGDLGYITNNETFEATFVGQGKITAETGRVSTSVPIKVVSKSKTLDDSGGRLESPTGFDIDVPRQSFDNAYKVEIAVTQSPGTAMNAQRISGVIDVRPYELTFEKSAKITFHYNRIVDAEFDPSKLHLHFWDSFQETWVWVSSHTDLDMQTVSANVNHFGVFTVMEVDRKIDWANKFQIGKVEINPPVYYSPETNRLAIKYFINTPKNVIVKVTIEIFDMYDQHVKTLLIEAERWKGSNVEQWDGRNEEGQVVKNGRYVVVIIAKIEDEIATAKKLLAVLK